MIWIKCLLIVILVIILYQDFRFKAVSWIFFPVGFIFTMYHAISLNSSIELLINLSVNVAFLLFQVVIIFLFSWFKYKKRVNIFKSVFGLGDLLFLVMILPLFSPLNFVLFFLGSIVFSLLVYLGIKSLKLYKSERVPLAGLQSMYLIIVLISQFLFKFNLYNDFAIINKLNILQ